MENLSRSARRHRRRRQLKAERLAWYNVPYSQKFHPNNLDGAGPSDRWVTEQARCNICGVDPAFELTPRQAYGLEITLHGWYGVHTQGMMYSRLCSVCCKGGIGSCHVSRQALTELFGDRSVPPRTKIILKRRTGFVTAECPVCYQSMQNCCLIHTKCNHLYHKSCFGAWLKKCPSFSPTCPMCRTDIEDVWSEIFPREILWDSESDTVDRAAEWATRVAEWEAEWEALEVERIQLELEMEFEKVAGECADRLIDDAINSV